MVNFNNIGKQIEIRELLLKTFLNYLIIFCEEILL